MGNMTELAHLLKDLETQLDKCSRCGMCQAVCPLFSQTGNEGDVARGKLALLDGLAKEMLKDAGNVEERLYRCLLCGSCETNCSSNVHIMSIFLNARAILVQYHGLPRIKKLVFRGLLARPKLFDKIMAMAAKRQHLFIKPADIDLGTSCARIVSPLLSDRRFLPRRHGSRSRSRDRG